MKKSRMRRRGLTLGAMTVGIALVVSVGAGSAFGAGDAKSLTVGSKDFAGAQLLSQLWGQALKAKGYDITTKDNIGPTEVVFPALENGDIDAYGEYQGTVLETQLKGSPTGDSAETYKLLQKALDGTDIVASKPAPAVDVNGFYVTKKTASKYKLKTVSDLVKASPKLTFGGPQECETRDLCLGPKEQKLYGFKFKDVKKLDAGGPITVSALTGGDIDVALLFTGSSVIPKGPFSSRTTRVCSPRTTRCS